MQRHHLHRPFALSLMFATLERGLIEERLENPIAAIAAIVFVVLGSLLLAAWLPWDRPSYLLGCQAAFGALGYALARVLPDFRRAFVREERATEMAQEQALQEFFRYGLHETEAKTGVLILVSLFERRVIVLAQRVIDLRDDRAQIRIFLGQFGNIRPVGTIGHLRLQKLETLADLQKAVFGDHGAI